MSSLSERAARESAAAAISKVAAMFPNGPHVEADEAAGRAPQQPDTARSTGTETNSGDAAVSSEADKRRATGPNLASLRAKLDALTKRANSGHPQALADLRHFLDQHPEVVAHVGDLTTLAEQAWINLLASDNALIFESAQRTVTALKSDLAGPNPTDLERLLIDHAAVAHLAARHAEITEATTTGGTLQQATYRLKRSESAQRRFLAAVKTLSTLRARAPQGLAPLNGLKLHDPDRKLA